MIDYFIKFARNNKDVNIVIQSINKIKHSLANGDFEPVNNQHENCSEAVKRVIEYAKTINDERLANASFVVEMYHNTFQNMRKFFNLLEKEKYEESWLALQDCFDTLGLVEKHGGENIYEIPDLRHILETFERFYPYKFFLSAGYIIGKASCSICGKSMLGVNCKHITGQLYWGEPACTIVEELFLKEISIVEHPDNKRCILKTENDDYTFDALKGFLSLNIPYMKLLKVKESTVSDEADNPNHVTYIINPEKRLLKWYYFKPHMDLSNCRDTAKDCRND